MRDRTLARLLLAGCLLPGGPLGAEDSPAPTIGSRVRVETASGRRYVGELLTWSESAVDLKLRSGKTAALPRTDLARIEVSTRPSRKGRGAGIGAAIGAGIAIVIGVGTGSDCSGNDWLCFSPAATAALGMILLVPAGVVVGAIAAPGERWEPVRAKRVQVGLGPNRGRGVGASVSVAW